MPTILEIQAASAAAKQAASHPATVARKAADAALDQIRPIREEAQGAVNPPVRLPTSPPPAPLPPPVELLTEAAALARLFSATAAATPDEAEHAARAEWLRSILPAAVAVDQGVAVFYPVTGISALAPHAVALLAAERATAVDARDRALGRAYRLAVAAGASPEELMRQLATVAG